jgi:hypothetical protein
MVVEKAKIAGAAKLEALAQGACGPLEALAAGGLVQQFQHPEGPYQFLLVVYRAHLWPPTVLLDQIGSMTSLRAWFNWDLIARGRGVQEWCEDASDNFHV